MNKARQQAYQRGVDAEEHAARYLEALGYEVLERRFKTSYGEVDLIARFEDSLIFVEVKAHQSKVESLMAVTARSRQRIQNAALYYMSMYEYTAELGMRFDVISVTGDIGKNEGGISVTHLDNAWFADT